MYGMHPKQNDKNKAYFRNLMIKSLTKNNNFIIWYFEKLWISKHFFGNGVSHPSLDQPVTVEASSKYFAWCFHKIKDFRNYMSYTTTRTLCHIYWKMTDVPDSAGVLGLFTSLLFGVPLFKHYSVWKVVLVVYRRQDFIVNCTLCLCMIDIPQIFRMARYTSAL